MSRIVILMGSPRKKGNTALLAQAFAEGAGLHNDVELIPVTNYKINPCIGCNSCYRREDHQCFQKDDMEKIYASLSRADIIVAASPVYFYSISAQLKALVDRLHSPLRDQFRTKKLGLLLVANSSLPTVFDSIKIQYRLILNYFHLEDAGSVMVRQVKEIGDIKGHPALQEAYDWGASIR